MSEPDYEINVETTPDRFRVIVIEALPSEVFEGQYGFAKLSDALNEEEKRGWIPRQVSTSWAQSYMIFTVILERKEKPKMLEENRNALRSDANDPHTSPALQDGTSLTNLGFSTMQTFLLMYAGIVGGVLLLFFGLQRAISVSDSLILGASIFGGFVLPAVLFIVGLFLIAFCCYEIGLSLRGSSKAKIR
jgi:hypothetical protein